MILDEASYCWLVWTVRLVRCFYGPIANNIETDIAQCSASLTVSQLESWMTRLLASVRKVGGPHLCVAPEATPHIFSRSLVENFPRFSHFSVIFNERERYLYVIACHLSVRRLSVTFMHLLD